MYIRKTRDEYEIQGYYSGSWEVVTTEETRKEAKIMLKCYDENEMETPHRIVKKKNHDSIVKGDTIFGYSYDDSPF